MVTFLCGKESKYVGVSKFSFKIFASLEGMNSEFMKSDLIKHVEISLDNLLKLTGCI